MSPKEEWAGNSGVGLTVVAMAAGVAMTAEGAALACPQGGGIVSRPTLIINEATCRVKVN